MHSRAATLLHLSLCLGTFIACAERQSPFEPNPVEMRSNLVMPPGVSDLTLPLGTWDPSYSLELPTYAEALIAEFRVEGIIGVNSAHPDRGSLTVDASGALGPGSNSGCFVNVVFKYWNYYTVGFGPCQTSPARSLRVDTAFVQGPGIAKRGGRIPQGTYDCPGAQFCWSYSGEQKVSVTPLFAAINLTTPGTPHVAPGVIELPAGGYATFKIISDPTGIKNIPVPIRVLSWQYVAAPGGIGGTRLTGPATAVERVVYLADPGWMITTAFVNGIEQIDTIKVVVPEVLITLQKASMEPSVRYTRFDLVPVNIPSEQEISFSVIRDNVPLVDRLVTLTLSANEGTAGHIAHPSNSKPKGNFKAAGTTIQLSTGATGIGKVMFVAPDPSGPVTVTGTSSGARADTVKIEVKVPALVELNPGAAYLLTGHTDKHPRNHYGTEAHFAKIRELADIFFAEFAQRPTFNDTSLELGGLYDVGTTAWTDPHKTHRFGLDTDLRTIDRTTPQLRAIRRIWSGLGGILGDETKKRDGTPNTTNPHYHLTTRN